MLLAAYGSLKKGYYNHGWLEGAEFLGTSTVRGVMYSNGSYPKLYHQHDDKSTDSFLDRYERTHVIEVYRVTEEQYEPIESMELGAGYVVEEIDTEWGKAKIFYMPHENFSSHDTWVEKY